MYSPVVLYMRLSGQFQSCFFFLRKYFEETKTPIKSKPTKKTKNEQTKNNKYNSFFRRKTSKRGKSFVLRFLKKWKLS